MGLSVMLLWLNCIVRLLQTRSLKQCGARLEEDDDWGLYLCVMLLRATRLDDLWLLHPYLQCINGIIFKLGSY